MSATFQPTEEMIQEFGKFFKIDANDESQRPGIIGSLNGISTGHSSGNGMAYLLDSPETREIFAPLREAFFKALGYTEMPPFSNVHIDKSQPGEGLSKSEDLTPPVQTQE